MNQEQFESAYKALIPEGSLEQLIDLFNRKKQTNLPNKFMIFLHKIKDKFTKTNHASFFELGYNKLQGFDFVNEVFDLSVQHDRTDIVAYMFKSDLLTSFNSYFYLRKIFDSDKVFHDILLDKEITDKIKPNEYGEMLRYCSVKNLPDYCDSICAVAGDKLNNIKQKQKDQIILEAGNCNSVDMLKKILHMKEPLTFDINTIDDDSFGVIYTRNSLLVSAARNNNLDLINYLLTSPELTEKADLSKSFLHIKELHNGKELLDYIIFDIKAPLTDKLEQILKDDSYLEIFKKRDLMLKIEDKLPAKNEKHKVRKI